MTEENPDATPSQRAHCGSSDALALAQLAAQKRPLVVFCARAAEAQRLREEIAWFAPALKTCLFPDWETLPYDTFSPHQDLISERLASLWRISRGEADLVLIPASTALYRVAPPSFLAGYTFHFKVKQKLDESELRAQLTLAGYQHVTQVVSPGEYRSEEHTSELPVTLESRMPSSA